MLFNSLTFAVFFTVVFATYWLVLHRSVRAQNLFLLAASYVFYAWWDWRFLGLILVSSVTDYTVGLLLGRTADPRARRMLLGASLAVNLGLLGFFKYFNFFVHSFVDAFAAVGLHLEYTSLRIVLPVGISFYTLQTLSYTIDVYRNRFPPTRDAVTFLTYVAFFPQLLAGPIERARNLIPQLASPRRFEYAMARDGVRQFLWGLFLKVVIADTLAPTVNSIFAGYETHAGSTLLLGGALFMVQVYGDFAGYSYMAIGTALLLGVRLTVNFHYPFLQPSMRMFWQRWHMSLMIWLREYMFVPLARLQTNRWRKVSSVFAVFLAVGLWHGANWTFVAWGAAHGAIVGVPMLLGWRVVGGGAAGRFLGAALTFLLLALTAPLFRSESIGMAADYYRRLLSPSLLTAPGHTVPVLLALLLVGWEWLRRARAHPLDFAGGPTSLRWAVYIVLAIAIIKNFGQPQQFVYFQF